MRDRLSNLQTLSASRNNLEKQEYPESVSDSFSNIELENHFRQQAIIFDDNEMDAVFEEAQDTRREIQLVHLDVKRLREQNTRILSEPTRTSTVKRDSNAIAADIKTRGENLLKRLHEIDLHAKELEEENGINSAVARIARTQYVGLSNSFRNVMMEYNEAEMNHKKMCKTHIQRQMEIVGREVTGEEIEEMLENGKWNIFSDNILTEGKTARSALNQIESRHRDLLELENRLKSIHEVFLDVAMLVEDQGPMIDYIFTNVQKTDAKIDDILMCSDGERSSGNGKLRQWLIEQVDTGKYPGLVWENEEKTVFRIPWKHAGKQDYNQDEDAALFKAWALFKGKYREGIDKPDPPTWKTRLRCALNKSNDFEELLERTSRSLEETTSNPSPPCYSSHPPHAPIQSQVCSFISPAERSWRDYLAEKPPMTDIPYNQNPYTSRWDTGYQFSGSLYSCNISEPLPSSFTLDASIKSAEAMALSDYRLYVTVYFRDVPVKEVTVNSLEGCILGVSKDSLPYGASQGPELVELPQIEHSSLEHGVLLWMAPDGLYAQLQSYTRHIRPPPVSQVILYFEEDSVEPQRPGRSLTVQVEPLFARQLLYLAHPSSINYIRSHNLSHLSPEHTIPPNQDFHRVISHHQSNSL
ncbi:Interferon regulatory factor 4 [Bagarius yarrelli]|uniref:Interferon regulatory factor 4 n=1 Tax=Bagarius yarrelli TaxID=175774 RepID=A0A556TSI9_BAGYA|nr:Interferon regulatory factor 4 [Bagarius yarrelli]